MDAVYLDESVKRFKVLNFGKNAGKTAFLKSYYDYQRLKRDIIEEELKQKYRQRWSDPEKKKRRKIVQESRRKNRRK